MLHKSLPSLLLQLTFFVYITQAIQLCHPYTQAYPCSTCQPYAKPTNGFCNCLPGYYMNVADRDNQFCDLCHASCKTCYGPLSTNCISCPDAFSFVSSTATCEQSDSSTNELLTQAYYIEGFTLLPDWAVNNFTAQTYQCGLKTILGGFVALDYSTPLPYQFITPHSISLNLSNLPNHFRLRVKANYFFFNANGTAKKAVIQIDENTNSSSGNDSGYSFETCGGANYVTRAIDLSVLHSGSSAVIYFMTDVDVHFGIRDVIVIAQKCASNCTTCTGYLATQCIICAEDPIRKSTLVTAGTCQCDDPYYQEPFAGTCADPCPSVPIKYYGDNTTRSCVTRCPTGYAFDDYMRCWADCPTTSNITNRLLYRDTVNKKCVANCPSAQPYGDPVDRKCYAVCPSPRYGDNTTAKICVEVCPHSYLDNTTTYKTYGLGRYCVPYCSSTTWADPATATCVGTCTNQSFPLMDNSTGQNLCVSTCPSPNRFADNGTCVEICPDTQYGDYITSQCVSTCSVPYWGLESYNRKCVLVCPSSTWARTSSRTCVNTTQQCDPEFANDYSRSCVAALDCPFGTFADPDTWHCVTFCPQGRYGHPDTRVCQTGCTDPYFRDDGVNLCVEACVTIGLYASVEKDRTCVSECNQTGAETPWADDSTRECVSDCNNTIGTYLSDNTTWKCVYSCPETHVADFTLWAPQCVITCPDGWFADNTTYTYRVCVQKCPTQPPKFGDTHDGLNLCVDVCAPGTFGDQTGNRLCGKTCPRPYFSQNDDLRRCVKICNESSYGYQDTCTYDAVDCPYSYNRICYESPFQCPTDFYGDDSTNLCVDLCPATQATFADELSRLCVRTCPNNPDYPTNLTQPRTYYADISIRKCVLTCNDSYTVPLFGNNNTRTCVPKCLDRNSFAEPQSTYRICVDRCWPAPTFHYANNLTKTCGTYNNCPSNYYGQNTTQRCLQFCPDGTWGYKDLTQRVCIDKCLAGSQGDDSTGKRICVSVCPSIPDRYVDLNLRICVDMCNQSFYGDPYNRTCVSRCRATPSYFSFETTRRCVQRCPYGYFADDRALVRKCQPTSSLCTGRFGDPYKRACVSTCTGPSPVNTFGSGSDCVSFCPNGTYADSHTGTRLCVQYCPPGVLNSVASPNLYGDPTTHTCVDKCITPDTWADFQTRLCQPTCSDAPIPTYSQNYDMTCVISLNCPTIPTLTFGDNTTRKCVSFCSNSEWGDPVSRNCVAQCPNDTETGTSTYYGDSSTGQYLCVIICPSLPRLFGENTTNLCVPECPPLTFGDQTGNRSCVPQCPLFNTTVYYAQNYSRICVLVCKDGTWGLESTRECVEDPFNCSSQWADNTTHRCVDICPVSAGTFGNNDTRICVPVCPPGTFADDLSRICVARCPQNNGVHDTFGNNDTMICQPKCTEPDGYGDPQTENRYCVAVCSQSPSQSFADPSTKTCVPRCPTFPSLFGQTDNFKCVSSCVTPYYADTHTRKCEPDCNHSIQYRLRSPRMCVTLCPSSPPLFGDNSSGYCESTCTVGFRYGSLRICVPSCTTYSLFDYNGTCVKYCPYGHYADTAGHCVNRCPLATLFGENTTTTCETTCITGYAHDRVCLAVCPDGRWGYNKQCKSSCPAGTASNISNLCVGLCDDGTYSQNAICVSGCTSGYADPNTRLCSSSCTLGRYGDSSTNSCVEVCPVNSYRDPSFTCKTDCNPLRADNITGTCTDMCSNGTWGYNYECVSICPPLYYGDEIDRDCKNITEIPDLALFADNTTQTWVVQCPINPLLFGDTQSHECVAECSDPDEYTDPESRQCQTQCTNDSYYKDPTTKDCVLICPDQYHGNSQNGWCQENCTLGLFDYEPARLCVVDCPKPYYGYTNGTELVCVIECLPGTFAEDVLCKPGCTPPLVADPVTHRCVEECVNSYYSSDAGACVADVDCATYSTIADSSSNTCVGPGGCPTDPDYYEEDGFCVPYCSEGTFADPTTGFRACTGLCTEGLYGDPVSGRCLQSCLPGYYAFNDTNICVKDCPNGFADNETGLCVSDCPAPTFADSLNNKCMRICTNGQFGQDRECVRTCRNSTYGNPITMQCEQGCPDFDYTFAENHTHRCVRNCSFIPNSYADRNTNYCIDHCSLDEQYALDVVGICTSLCPEGQFMENSTKKCQPECSTGYAEKTSRYCVARCFGNPQTFAYFDDLACVYSCKALGLYADNSSNYCVAFDNCSRANNSYSDPISGNCVYFCPEGLYAEDTNFTCTSFCAIGFADNLTRRCVSDCPVSEETFADSTTSTCVKVCPDGWFARNDTQICVEYNNCPTDTYSDILSKHCVARCPSQPLYFGLDNTTSCVTQCPSSLDLFGDYVTQKCIWPCPDTNGEMRFADEVSRTCVFVCPITQQLYGDPTTGRCTDSCHPDNMYKDNSTQRCTPLCPSDPDYYAYNSTTDKYCVRKCPDGFYASDNISRICTDTCEPWLTFKDQTTNQCVQACPQNYFADNSTFACVQRCPSTPDYYASSNSGQCVFICPVGPLGTDGLPTWMTFIEVTNRTCVTRCPQGQFAQNSSGRCMGQCPVNEYADPIIQRCVADCTVRPGYYKQTGSRTCVENCPTSPVKAHRYQPTHVCVNMTGTVSGCTGSYYADQLSDNCTTLCPSGYFADTFTRFCRLNCTNGRFADPVDRTCKMSCTTSPNYYQYSGNHTCLQNCPSNLFSQNVTWTCIAHCPNQTDGVILYAYKLTKQCVRSCPAPYYSYIDNQTCLLSCPEGWFKTEDTRSCEQTCTGTYYADDSTNKCVQTCPFSPNLYGYENLCIYDCPNGTYKDDSTRTCVDDCPYLPLTFADDSNNECVFDCPSEPNYFADNQTRTCVFNCSDGFFADPSTRTCVESCPPNSDTYAEPVSGVCQPSCPPPTYKSDLTNQCVELCPNVPVKTYAQDSGRVCTRRCIDGLFGNNFTRICEPNCLSLNNSFADRTTNLCVTTCPIGFFSFNDTAECRRDCPGLYSDTTTRKCVAQCPGTERLYADDTTGRCVSICPVGSYGDDDSWTCKSSCANVSAGYILQVERRCVPQCPSPYFALVSQRLCVENCGLGLYGDQISRQCKPCPQTCITCLSPTSCLSCSVGLYLEYGFCVEFCTLNDDIANYANNVSMTCGIALRCPPHRFGYNFTKKCETQCPTQMYGNTTTKTCQNCPSTCSTCTGLLNCSTCVTTAEFSPQDSMCYAHCSPTQQYAYSGECYDTCPTGTYVDFTNVNCLACNAICLTCFGSSMNCTGCDGTFQFNNTCVTQCPTGYYGQSNQCLACSAQISSCSNPLTFTTTSIVQNYQQVIVVKFNQQTTIKSDPSRFMKINLQMTRRLIQDSSSLINNGLGFNATVLPDGTIKLYLDPGVSLENVRYTVSFTDPTQVTTLSGDTLQNLEAQIEIAKAEVYPDTYTTKAPLVIVGKILAIVMLALTFIMLIFGLTPLYFAIEAVQLVSLFAYTRSQAPNLYYFLKEMRLSRFVFIPSIFENVYDAPQGFNEKIPQKVLDTEGHLSFALNAGQFIYFVLFYLVMALIVFLFTSKLNSNRPLKNLFIRIWETRIKFGVVHDFLWLFGLNILTQAFMQIRYTDNHSDLALGIVIAVFVLVLMFGQFGYGVKKWKENPELITNNYSLLFEGTKEMGYHKFFIFIYYARKILLAAVIVGAVYNTLITAALGLTIFSIVGLFILIIRPYKQHLRNLVILINEGFLGFFCGGLIYFMKMVDRKEPSGAKITNGYILTIVIIIHLCLIMVWGVYCSYFYLKELWEEFKKTQFYKLYLDEEYDEILEKQISQLNEEDKGEVQSIQVTNIGANQGKQGEEQEQIIRLKIKRRVKKEKIKKPVEKEEEHKDRMQGEFVKVQKENQKYYKLKNFKESQFEKVVFDEQPRRFKEKNDSPIEQSKENDWVKVQQISRQEQIGKSNQEVAEKAGYKGANIQNIFDELQQNQSKLSKQEGANLIELQEMKPEQTKVNVVSEEQIKKQKYLETDRKMRETFKSSFADFDEVNYFHEEQNKAGQKMHKQKQQKLEQYEKQQEQPKEDISNQNKKVEEPYQDEVFQKADEEELYSQQFQHQSQQDLINFNQEPSENVIERQPNQNLNKPVKNAEDNPIKGQQYQQIKSHSNKIASQEQILVPKQNKPNYIQIEESAEKKQQDEYKVFNFDDMDIQQSQEKQQVKEPEKQEKQEKKPTWSLDIEDLLDDHKNDDEEEKKRQQKSKKMHLMLFEDEDLQ